MENEDKYKGAVELRGSTKVTVKWCLFLVGDFWFVSGMGWGVWRIYIIDG